MQRLYLKSSNIEASLGVFFDSFIKIMIAITVFSSVLNFSLDTIFKTILPSFSISIFALQIFFFILCFYINKTKSKKTIPLPSGISSNRFFVWIFAIIIPTYANTGNLSLALSVAIGANFISSALTMFLAFFSSFILRFIPSPALFANISGASLAWLVIAPLKEAFNTPIIALVCFFIVLTSYIGSLKTKIPPLLISIIVGIIISIFTKNTIDTNSFKISTQLLGFYLPNFFNNLFVGIKEAYKFFPIILAITIVELISSIQGVEQAKKLGAKYNTTFVLFFVSFISLLSSFFGNPFTLSVLWGYSTWYKIKASRNYVIYIGIFFLVIGTTGISFLVMKIIPIASIIPIIIFIGLINISETFKNCEEKYYIPMIIGISLPIMDLLKTVVGNNITASLNFLANGATLISLFWGSLFVLLVDKKYLNMFFISLICAALSFFGLIHSSQLELFANNTFSILYLLFAFLFFILQNFKQDI